MAAMIATVFPPISQYVGGAIGAAICVIATRYFTSKWKWSLLIAMGAGFMVGQIIVGHTLISMGAYQPIVVPDKTPEK